MRVESAVIPSYKQELRGQIFVNFNVEEVTTEDGVKYVYEQLRFNPPMSDEALDKEVAKRQEELKVKTITMRQARLKLLAEGLLDIVEAAVAADTAMTIWWEYSTEIELYHNMTQAMATQSGITQLQLETLFEEASKL